MKRISVIIPLYKAEQYIDTCLNSLLPQLTAEDEVILVDGDSQDGTKEKCEKYCEENSIINYVCVKNEGPSKNRNIGIEKAVGKYIIFLDIDDYIEPNYIEEMLKQVDEYDLKICGYYFERQETGKVTLQRYSENTDDIVLNKEDAIILAEKKLFGIVWNKVYHSQIIKKYNIRFDEKVTKGEDALFNLDYVAKINTPILVTNKLLYHYISKKTGVDLSFKEPIENRFDRIHRYYEKYMLLGDKNTEKVVRNMVNTYFLHLRKYCGEQNIKSPWKIQKTMKDMTEKSKLSEMLKHKEVEDIKRDYDKGHIVRMYVKNKLELMKEN